MKRKRLVVFMLGAVALYAGNALATDPVNLSGETLARANAGHPVRVVLASHVVDLCHSAPVRVSGTTAGSVEVRLVGAIDRGGRPYEWSPYPWRALRDRRGIWRGLLPAPPLFGIYRLRLRLDHGRRFLSSARWLMRVRAGADGSRRLLGERAAVEPHVREIRSEAGFEEVKGVSLERPARRAKRVVNDVRDGKPVGDRGLASRPASVRRRDGPAADGGGGSEGTLSVRRPHHPICNPVGFVFERIVDGADHELRLYSCPAHITSRRIAAGMTLTGTMRATLSAWGSSSGCTACPVVQPLVRPHGRCYGRSGDEAPRG
jgi:hypothetical protein